MSRNKNAHALGAALAVLLIAATSRADSSETSASYPPSSAKWKLAATGLGFTAVSYGATLFASTEWPKAPGASDLKIPIVGPWVALANNGCPKDDPDCGASKYIRGFLTGLSGLAQLGGLVILGEGVFAKTEDGAPHKVARPVVKLVPMFGRTNGAMLQGRF